MTSYDIASFLEKVEQIAKQSASPKKTDAPSIEPSMPNGQQVSQKELIEALHTLLRDQKSANSITYISGGTFMGDVFRGIRNSTVVNRSTISDALNSIRGSCGDELANALHQLGQLVSESGSNEAGELYESFVEEVAKPQPKQTSLKTIWGGIEAALPTVKTVADIAGTITKLLT